jgi:hypothetical protein
MLQATSPPPMRSATLAADGAGLVAGREGWRPLAIGRARASANEASASPICREPGSQREGRGSARSSSVAGSRRRQNRQRPVRDGGDARQNKARPWLAEYCARRRAGLPGSPLKGLILAGRFPQSGTGCRRLATDSSVWECFTIIGVLQSGLPFGGQTFPPAFDPKV